MIYLDTAWWVAPADLESAATHALDCWRSARTLISSDCCSPRPQRLGISSAINVPQPQAAGRRDQFSSACCRAELNCARLARDRFVGKRAASKILLSPAGR